MFWGVGCSLGTGWDGGLGMKAVVFGGCSSGVSCCCLVLIFVLCRSWFFGLRLVVCLGGGGWDIGVMFFFKSCFRGSRGRTELFSC